MVNVSWLPPVFADASSRLFQALKSGDFVPGSTVSLAVTGLSRSGKTVFITSLVHNLLSTLHNPNRMPLLRVVGDGPARNELTRSGLLHEAGGERRL